MKHYNKNRYVFVIFFLVFTSVLCAENKLKLVILHTNDTHSQIEPTEKSSLKTSDMGGYARRMGQIEKIRSEEDNVLLFDAGDYFQGTPYFNIYNGRLEIDFINRMKYDAITIGNHEFDNGIDSLHVLLNGAKVPIISSNYDASKSPIGNNLKRSLIINRFGLKIGVMALNVNPKSLIMENNYRGLAYNDPLKTANKVSKYLKRVKKCDIVICLSHLGSDAKSLDVNDFKIAQESKYIDVIIGGHSHSLLKNSFTQNIDGKKVIIAQVGKSGLNLGRIDLELEQK